MIKSIFFALGRFLLSCRYRVSVSGLEQLDATDSQGTLILPNHPAYVDPVLVYLTLSKKFDPYILIDEKQLARPLMGVIKKMINLIPIPDVRVVGKSGKEAVTSALTRLSDHLKQGKNVLLYPAGTVYRTRQERVQGTSAVYRLLSSNSKMRVIMVRTTGLWGSSLSWAARGAQPELGKRELVKYLLYLICNCFFFMPKRKVDIELVCPRDFPVGADKNIINEYLQDFYNKKSRPNTFVPYFFWQGFSSTVMPEPEIRRSDYSGSNVLENTKRLVFDYLHKETGCQKIQPTDKLVDLGLDSLERAELLSWLEREFGHPQADGDSLESVQDVLLAASGEIMSSGEVVQLSPIEKKWFARKDKKRPASFVDGDNIIKVFLRRARQNPDKAIVADQVSGVKTYRDLIIALFLMVPLLKKNTGNYLGIMLPASVASVLSFLAVMVAGKIPVMLNWTVGRRNLQHAAAQSGVEKIITSRLLVAKLESSGVELDSISHLFLFLEDLKQQMKPQNKFRAFIKSYLSWRCLEHAEIATYSALLFTSGSESLPKAVPLTHRNHLSNLQGALKYLAVEQDDRLIGFLPPFHSFGLMVNIIAPLCLDIPIVFHSNPTEGAIIAELICQYQATILAGTPTFLRGILRAGVLRQFSSLRLGLVGAEKCPVELFELVKLRAPHLEILEGYGITECSPIIAINPAGASRQGTIGLVLPNLEYALAEMEAGHKDGPYVLLVKGPSIFGGYLGNAVESPFVDYQGKTWYRTNDLVNKDKDNFLIFEGRLKRFVKIGGEMISLPAIESVLNQAYACDVEMPVLAVEAREIIGKVELILFTTLALEREQVNKMLTQHGLSSLHNIRQIISMDNIPLLGTGKVDYLKLKEII